MLELPEEFPLRERTLGHILARNARNLGAEPLIIEVGGDSISYRDMDEQANRIAHGLVALDVEHQEPVLFMMPDCIDTMALCCGLARRGAVEVPINLAYRGRFLTHVVNDSTARTIVIEAQYLERLALVVSELTHLERCIIYRGEHSVIPKPIADKFELLAFETLVSSNSTAFANDTAFRDLIGIMYTSGTTGASKGVMVCHAHAYRYAADTANWHGVGMGDRYYSAGLPLFHVAGQWGVVYGAMIRGGTAVLRNGYRNEHFWRDIAEHRVTSTFLLGAIANFIWQQPETPHDADTPLEKVGMYPVIPEHEAFSRRFGVKIATGYGSTEDPGAAMHPLGMPFPNNQCVGTIRERFEVRIVDQHDIEVPVGSVGEICSRSKDPWEIMIGYWNRPEATVAAFRNLWYHTGDVGYVDECNRLYFVDRLTDSLRRRGENISSMEVEDVVNQHPDVLECAVFPVWAEESEQEVMVAVTPQPEKQLDPVSLVHFCSHRMPYFMVPRYIDVTNELPKTPTGKIQKKYLREQGVRPTTWNRVASGIKLER